MTGHTYVTYIKRKYATLLTFGKKYIAQLLIRDFIQYKHAS